MRRAFHAGEDDPGTLTDKARLLRCFVAVLFALAVGSARAQVVITHGLATNVTTTVLATLTNLSAHPPSLLVSNGTASVTGAFSSGASGRIAILYTGCKIFDESAFTATSNHVLNFQAGSWGVANDPSGPAVGRGAAISEAIVFRFDTSVFTPLSGQVLVLSTVQAAGNYPASSAIVRNDGGGHTTRFAAATNGLTALDLRITNGSEFAYIHDSSTGGSRLAQITLDIVAATAVTATPDVVVGTHRPVTLQWVSHVVPTDATVELAADRPATFGAVTGNAADGRVTATVADGANGNVTFTVTLKTGAVAVAAAATTVAGYALPATRPNLLFITVDDMNYTCVGAFGCPLADTTPNLDRLAANGLRFTRAHVVSGNCMPSRNVMMSGLYPHTSGVEGFDRVPGYTYKLLPDMLKDRGYFRSIFHKVSHTTPDVYPWDLKWDDPDTYPAKDPHTYYTLTREGILAALAAGKPFYVNMNLADPHLPFYGLEQKSTNLVRDPYVPSKLFDPEEVPIPGFLPGGGEVPLELAHYYMSVRRADDSVGNVLKVLDELGLREHTLVVFTTDHGMPEPFAKACVYNHSTHTPLIYSWPGVIRTNAVDDYHMVSGIDLMPTLLDVVGSPHPYGLQGKSYYRVLLGETLPGFDQVIKEHDQVSEGSRQPMRSVQTRRYGYIWNPWANGTRDVVNATEGMLADKRMQSLAAGSNAYWAARDHLFEYRTPEEFYDYDADPDALTNLIGRSDLQAVIAEHRQRLLDWMERTYDHALDAFRNRTNAAVVEAYVQSQSAGPPVVSEFTSLQRMMEHLELRINPADISFNFTVDPRLPTVVWELLTTTNLCEPRGNWGITHLTNGTVAYDSISGKVRFLPAGPRPPFFFGLQGTVPP